MPRARRLSRTLAGVALLALASACNEVSGVSGLDFGTGGQPGAGTGGGASGPPTAAQLLALTTSCKVVSTADYQNDENPMAADIPVCGLTGAVFWQAGMSIDCDGASHASPECPSSSNETAATNAMGGALSSVGLPFVVVPDNSGCTPLRWDYFRAGLAYGSVIAVIYDGRVSYGVLGDTGTCTTIGQASYAMAKSLGIDPGPENAGVQNSVTYIAFTSGNDVASPIDDHTAAVTLGEALSAALLTKD